MSNTNYIKKKINSDYGVDVIPLVNYSGSQGANLMGVVNYSGWHSPRQINIVELVN